MKKTIKDKEKKIDKSIKKTNNDKNKNNDSINKVLKKTYIVESLEGKKYNEKEKKNYYFVKWKGYSYSQNTWEPEEHLENLEKEIKKFNNDFSRNLFFNEILNIPEPEKNKITLPVKQKVLKKQKTENEFIEKLNKTTKESLDIFMEYLKNDEKIIVKKKILKGKNENEIEDIEKYGNLKKDIPERIIDHNTFENENSDNIELPTLVNTFFKIQWEKRKNGEYPKPSYFSYWDIKEKYPKLILEYLKHTAIVIKNK